MFDSLKNEINRKFAVFHYGKKPDAFLECDFFMVIDDVFIFIKLLNRLDKFSFPCVPLIKK